MDSSNQAMLMYVAIAMAVSLPFAGSFLFNKRVGGINMAQPLSRRLTQYITASIIRFALIEGAGLFNIVVALLSGNMIPKLVSVMLILFLIVLRPIKTEVAETLQVTYPETLE